MRSRFQIDSESGQEPAGLRKDDAGADEITANLDRSVAPGQFVLEESGKPEENLTAEWAGRALPQAGADDAGFHGTEDEASSSTDHGDWRGEVMARVNRYRERRGPKEPRYPSLRLKFDGQEPSWRSAASQEAAASALGTAALSLSVARDAEQAGAIPEEPSAKIIEFPRTLILPTVTDELAEPILDRPRIIEAPELVPPPPALGGIAIEQSAEQPRRQEIEVPLQVASITRRVAAAVVDAAIVGSALALFGYIFLRISGDYDGWRHPNLIVGIIPALFWFAYQYLFTVHAKRTPGTAVARMKLQTFSGESAPRTLRRCRILTSVLSALSLGLGYAWCFLDEDQLCWHDRITRTYLAPRRSAP
jgi:hypothetical protein